MKVLVPTRLPGVLGLLLALLLLAILPCAARAADEFKWSWQKEEARGGASAPAASGPAAASPGEPAAPPTAARAPGVDPAAYAELLKSNEEMRRRIDEAIREKESIERKNAALDRQVKGLEQEITRVGVLAEQLKKEKSAAEQNPDKVVGLETRLGAAEREKLRMEQELAALRTRERQLAAEAEKVRARPSAAPAAAGEGEPVSVKPGSDLYREVERENARLKTKLVQMEAERQKAVRDRDAILKKDAEADEKIRRAIDEQKKLEQKLAEYEKAEKDQKELIKKLMRQLPDMEKELARLKSTANESGSALGNKEEEIAALKTELERRDHRLVKAEKMARLLEESRSKVQKASSMEKRDLHYNMAVIYAKEGRIADAEREYLSALKIDPADPDVHYNLGILYEEDFKDRSKAARHYRKYLEIAPYATDADQVKGWLLRFEMQ